MCARCVGGASVGKTACHHRSRRESSLLKGCRIHSFIGRRQKEGRKEGRKEAGSSSLSLSLSLSTLVNHSFFSCPPLPLALALSFLRPSTGWTSRPPTRPPAPASVQRPRRPLLLSPPISALLPSLSLVREPRPRSSSPPVRPRQLRRRLLDLWVDVRTVAMRTDMPSSFLPATEASEYRKSVSCS